MNQKDLKRSILAQSELNGGDYHKSSQQLQLDFNEFDLK